MAVEIKELVIKGKVNKQSFNSEQDIVKLIDSRLSKKSSSASLKETDKRKLIDECVLAVLNELESKLGY